MHFFLASSFFIEIHGKNCPQKWAAYGCPFLGTMLTSYTYFTIYAIVIYRYQAIRINLMPIVRKNPSNEPHAPPQALRLSPPAALFSPINAPIIGKTTIAMIGFIIAANGVNDHSRATTIPIVAPLTPLLVPPNSFTPHRGSNKSSALAAIAAILAHINVVPPIASGPTKRYSISIPAHAIVILGRTGIIVPAIATICKMITIIIQSVSIGARFGFMSNNMPNIAINLFLRQKNFVLYLYWSIFVSNTQNVMKKLFTATLLLCFAMSALSQNMITSSAIQEPQFTKYSISFPEGKSTLYKEYGENSYALKNLSSHINKCIAQLRSGEYLITVVSSVKGDENKRSYERLARKRALTLKSYLIKTLGIKEDYFKTSLKVNQDQYLIEGINIGLSPAERIKDNTAIAIPIRNK